MKPECVTKLKEQFKGEQMAFAKYEEIHDMVEDEYLKGALEEIMYDEYLHAKFLRSYMIEKGVYNPAEHIECEKAFEKMIDF